MTGNADKWIYAWELQQNLEIKGREERFSFMFDVVGHYSGTKPKILDLACGPGSLGGKFTARYPHATSVGVDYDPVLLHLARSFSGYDHNRMRFVEADLGKDDWVTLLNSRDFDAVMSTTALHWLNESSLRRVYGEIYSLLGENGIFLNGDHLYPLNENGAIKELFNNLRHKHQEQEKTSGKALTWNQWWEEISEVEEFRELLEERKRRYPNADRHTHEVSLEQHREFLRDAGFRAIEVGWQDLDNRVLIALK